MVLVGAKTLRNKAQLLGKQCPVCRDDVNGVHYGVYTCDSCKSFFKRAISLKKFEHFKCSVRKTCRITRRCRSCQYCRFQKCLKIEAYLSCPVCGDVTSGIHYGVRTCESCKLFFKRTIQMEKENGYFCTANMSCIVSVATRTSCKLCRYRRCIISGMKPSLVTKKKLYSSGSL